MITRLKASDIFEIAIRIEENGARFYRHTAQLFGTEEVKALFETLANDEERHREVFRTLRTTLPSLVTSESYHSECISCLNSYVDDIIVFQPELFASEVKKIQNATDALYFAIRREVTSIFYYQQIGVLLPSDRRKTLDDIINEERSHYTALSEERQRLGDIV